MGRRRRLAARHRGRRLIGNFTGEADFLDRREVVAGNPKIYGQLVQLLAPFTEVGRGPIGHSTG